LGNTLFDVIAILITKGRRKMPVDMWKQLCAPRDRAGNRERCAVQWEHRRHLDELANCAIREQSGRVHQ
jgi:hypothetical protein